MSQLSIKLSDKADALIAQLQKEIFNRRRKKVTAAGVVESLVESGARSQSDKRFATSWTNLIQDIEKAAKLANAHGSKPSSLTDEEWVMVLSHRARAQSSPVRSAKTAVAKTVVAKTSVAKTSVAKTVTAKKPAAKKSAVAKTAAKTAAKKQVAKKPVVKKAVARKAVAQKAGVGRSGAATATTVVSKPRPARRARKTAAAGSTSTSVAKRMAKAAGRLASGGSLLSTTAGSNGINSPARS